MRLKELIQASGKQHIRLSKDLGISKQKISHWQTGYSEPCIDDLILLARYFDVSVDYIVGNVSDDGTLALFP